MKDKQKRKKERTWAEAARMVLENFSDAPMTPKQILHVIQTKGLKEMSGTAPLACLVTMLHSQVRGDRVKNSIFFKLPGRMSLFTLKKNALQWTKGPVAPEPVEPTAAVAAPAGETAEPESDSTETAVFSGENDASVDETSSSASCSTEPHTRLSRSTQSGRQRKKAVMMPRVVLTPLKVNGEHVPPGIPGKRRDGSGGVAGSSALPAAGARLRNRSEHSWKGIRALRSGPMKRSRGVEVDFETPGSILVNTNIRALINTRTFAALPSPFQQQLLQLLPEVDRQVGADGLARLSSSALNNEFFTHASQSWKERLAEGEFTHEMQTRFRQEMEKEKKVEVWKEKFFEEYHGQRSGLTREESLKLTMDERGDGAGSGTGDEAAAPAAPPKRRTVGRRRRDGRMRRRSRADLRRRAKRSICKAAPAAEPAEDQPPTDAPALVPEAGATQPEVVLQTDPGHVLEPCQVAAPVSSPAAPIEPEPQPEVSGRLCPETPGPASSSSSSSSSSSDSSSSPASSPSSSSERRGCLPASSAAAADPLETLAATSSASVSRECSPVAQVKEQKRRKEESQAYTCFPEKRPRLDDRQSFRNTIDCVHSEKPQPTAEEPKVPPIRIQLSRIKPPWVKGPPTYQICPRIVPPSEGSRRSGTGARTLADIKARAQQARAQREAAAAVAATGDGAGPGGGGPGGGTGVPDRGCTGRRAREHPGPIEPGGGGVGGSGGGCLEEEGTSAGSHRPGAQLLLPHVERCDSPQPAGGEISAEEEGPTCTGSPSDQVSDTTAAEARSPPPDPEGECKTLPAATLAPTSIPDTLPRFGAQGVDVTRTLTTSSHAEQSAGRLQGLGGETQASDYRGLVETPSSPGNGSSDEVGGGLDSGVEPVPGLPGGREEDGHSDSTETASDLENEDSSDWCVESDSTHGRAPDVGQSQSLVQAHPPIRQTHLLNTTISQPIIQAHHPNISPSPPIIQAQHPDNLSEHAVIQAPDQSVHTHLFNSPQSSAVHAQNHQPVIRPFLQGEMDQSGTAQSKAGDEGGGGLTNKAVVDMPRAPGKAPVADDCRGSSKLSHAAALRKSLGSTRLVSSVEANNPLVTQLLQGSLPLEKVLPQPHSASKLEINRFPARGPTACFRELSDPGGLSESTALNNLRAPAARGVMGGTTRSQERRLEGPCLLEEVPPRAAPGQQQDHAQSGRGVTGAVPVITALSSRRAADNQSAEVRERPAPERPGAGPQPHCRSVAETPSPPHGDLCPPEVVPSIKIDWRPKSAHHQLSPAPAPTVKNEAARPSCQAVAKNPLAGGATTKREAQNSGEPRERYFGGGAIEGLLNMEMSLVRMAKKEQGKYLRPADPSSPSLPFQVSIQQQLYGKLPKLPHGGAVSYTANVSMVDASGFSRNIADSVLQLRQRGGTNAALSIQAFADSAAQEVALKCSCRLKAMIMCQGCGAFCHDDCIGPSKLCVSCLVVR